MDKKIEKDLINLCGKQILEDEDIEDWEKLAFEEIALTQAIKKGKQGDGWLIIQHFINSYREKGPIRTDLFDFIISAFEKILKGKKPEKALLLYKGPGNKSNSSLEMQLRDFIIFTQVSNLMENGHKFQEAVHAVACKLRPEDPFTAEENVARIYKKGLNLAKAILEEIPLKE